MQGAKLAVVNSTDLIALIVAHPMMKDLQRETTTAYVQRETGAMGGVARAVQAATSPTAGQRMLQAGFHGAIMGGESSEKTTASTDAEGNVRVDRVVQRSVVGEGGQVIILQQAQQSACAAGAQKGPDASLWLVEIERMKSEWCSDLHAANMKTTELMAKLEVTLEDKHKAQLEDTKKVYDAVIEDLKAKYDGLHETLNSFKGQLTKALKRAASKPVNAPAAKQPRLSWLKKDHPELPKNIFFTNGSFGWSKTIKGKLSQKSGFATIAEAQKGLALHVNGGASRDIASMMGGGSRLIVI